VLVTARPGDVAALRDLAAPYGVDVAELGTVGGDRVTVTDVVDLPLRDVLAAVRGAVPGALGLA